MFDTKARGIVDILFILLLFLAGLLAGVMNVMSGGGSMLTLPVLILAGLDSATANGTNRIGIITQSLAGMAGFAQKKLDHDYAQSVWFSLLTLPGAIIGAYVAVAMNDTWFRYVLVAVLLFSAASLFIPLPKPDTQASSARRWLAYPAMLGIGFYGGFIQVGVGFLFMAVLYNLLHMRLLYVNAHKVVVILVYSLPALGVFWWNDKINWSLGIALATGSALGGWLAAHWSLSGGDVWIRRLTLVIVVLMSVKLLLY